MFKLLIALSAVIVVVSAGIPTAEEAKAEMIAAGVSSQAAEGIIKLAPDFSATAGDREAAHAAFENYMTQVGDYMKTQSSEDQAAFAAFVEKKKAEHQQH
ncbi:hypothetical protein CAEBREN_14716 [Caenorhabditis brenneri]|uniref:Uncharacterized protein n=1 Tax=Caenorhabditis brenneri TaxID=135651 RepID=G0NF68_CAEBE|nr:hypothetical protein CAEBREN_14716 [Caenorhabditis brenneri]